MAIDDDARLGALHRNVPREIDVCCHMLSGILSTRFDPSVLDDDSIGGKQDQRGRAVSSGDGGVETGNGLLYIVCASSSRRRSNRDEGDDDRFAPESAAAQATVTPGKTADA